MKVDYFIVTPSFNEVKNIINIFNKIKLSLKDNYEIIPDE